MKSFFLLLLCQLILFAAGQPLKSPTDIDATSRNTAQKRVHRALKPDPPICSFNQYFDKEEGRCLGVTGGGRVLYINSTNTCSVKALQPHCTNPRYYYICKNDKTILAECIQGQHFDSRLQKCVDVNPEDLVSSTAQPNLDTFESIQLPECKEPGPFPVPDDCTLFYTCETNGHRMFQSIFRCPKDMAYETETKMCDFSSSCNGTNLNIPFCASVINREHRHVKKPTKVTHTTDTATIFDTISTEDSMEDVTLANTVSVTPYDNPTSTFPYNDLSSTEFNAFVDETSSTESNHLHSLDTTTFSYSSTSGEFLPTDQFTETSTFVGSTLETDLLSEGLSTENAVTEVVTSSTSSSEEISTTENSMVAEKIVQSTTEFVTTSTTDLLTPDNANFEVQTTVSTETSTLGLESSTSMNSELNEQSDLSTTEKETDATEQVTEPSEMEQDFPDVFLAMNEPNDTNSESVTSTSTEVGSTSSEVDVTTQSVSEETSPEHTTVSADYSPETTVTDKQDFNESTTEEITEDPMLLLNNELSRLTTANSNENENSTILSTTSSYDANTEYLKNDMNNQSAVTKAPDNANINADDKSFEQDKLSTTTPSANNIQNSENVSNAPTLRTVSDSKRPEINSDSLNKQLHSLVPDKQNAASKENDIPKYESAIMPNMMPSTGRVSTDVILPIMSAVFRIIDMIERCLLQVLGTVQH
ncbi:uncharacterized protein LOC105662924 [Megachile rotundata]|uniref:uncharacterized protein LOC105662924 n=1 Tax=Megachile rotundata TaxID=143995 RepID=UPI003FD3B4A7